MQLRILICNFNTNYKLGYMKKIILFIFLIVSISCTGPDEKEVQAVVHGIIQADNKSDLEKVLSYYKDEATLFPPGDRPTVQGKENIMANYASIFSNTKLNLKVSIEKVSIVDRKVAWCTGRTFGEATNLDDNSVREVNDKYVMMLEKVDEGWRIVSLKWGF